MTHLEQDKYYWFYLTHRDGHIVGGPIVAAYDYTKTRHDGKPYYYVKGITDEEYFNHFEPFIGNPPLLKGIYQ